MVMRIWKLWSYLDKQTIKIIFLMYRYSCFKRNSLKMFYKNLKKQFSYTGKDPRYDINKLEELIKRRLL